MAPHVLRRREKDHICTVCGVAWTALRDRDVRMLETEGACLGRRERWVRCQRRGGLCWAHEDCQEKASA